MKPSIDRPMVTRPPLILSSGAASSEVDDAGADSAVVDAASSTSVEVVFDSSVSSASHGLVVDRLFHGVSNRVF